MPARHILAYPSLLADAVHHIFFTRWNQLVLETLSFEGTTNLFDDDRDERVPTLFVVMECFVL